MPPRRDRLTTAVLAIRQEADAVVTTMAAYRHFPNRKALSHKAAMDGGDTAEDAILRTLAETRTKLAGAGVDFPPGQDGDFSCTRCACEFFTSKKPGLVCDRTGCGHSFALHRVR